MFAIMLAAIGWLCRDPLIPRHPEVPDKDFCYELLIESSAPQKEVGGKFVVAGGEASAVFQTAEHALDGVAAFVEGLAEAAFPDAITLGRDVGDGTLILDDVADAVAVVSAVVGLMPRRRASALTLSSLRCIARRTASVVVALPCKTWPIVPPATHDGQPYHHTAGLNT